MLTQKVDKKKNLIYGVVLGAILIIVAVLLLKNYVFRGGSEEKESFLTSQTNLSGIGISVKKFDAGFLQDSRYKALKDNSVKIKDMVDLKIGKENPFMIN